MLETPSCSDGMRVIADTLGVAYPPRRSGISRHLAVEIRLPGRLGKLPVLRAIGGKFAR